ncbi:hypothetical protein GRJ2_001502800 [Grus japonensis]|uniref:Uncharacterized protein n=1 Tax=Grus japonensis TaxID=30415 RepID=A0ABC9WY65_GRUJA
MKQIQQPQSHDLCGKSKLICWPNTDRFSQRNSGPKDTHCQVSSSCLQMELLFTSCTLCAFVSAGRS